MVQYSTVQFGSVQYGTFILPWEKSVKRAKRSKGQTVIEVHSRLGHLKKISHLSLFSEEGPSCYCYIGKLIYQYFSISPSILFHVQ